MGTLGTRVRNGKKKVAARRVERTKEPHPAIGKLAVALRERDQALQQQAATAEILKVISSSPRDRRPAFKAILKSALRLCDAHLGVLNLREADGLRTVAQRGGSAKFAAWVFERGVFKPDGGAVVQTLRAGRAFQVADARQGPDYLARKPNITRFVDLGGVRTFLAVPLLKDGEVIGNIGIYRREVRPFADAQIALVKTFADQAVIAIENARQFNETKSALARQTSTAEILRVLGRSMTDAQPVFDAIVKNCRELFKGAGVVLRLALNGRLEVKASLGAMPGPVPIDRTSAIGTCVVERRTLHFPDLDEAAKKFPRIRQLGLKFGYRSGIYAPLTRGAKAIGAIGVLRRDHGAFDDKDVQLLNTFADQAVIAIENVRLFNQTKEALEQQTASSEVLGVISSSPTDLAPVFDAILASATRLCDAHLGLLNLREDDKLRTVAQRGGAPEFVKWVSERGPFKPSLAIAMETRQPIQIPDITETPAFKAGVEMAVKFLELGGARTYLTVPLLKDGILLGSISIYRPEVRPFTDKQIELVKTFANQAVIAIENVRLFTELRARNDDLRISLEQQTATSELLKVIGRSTLELRPVFETLAENAVRLCEAERAVIFRFDGQLLRFAAGHNVSPELLAFFEAHPIPPGRNSNAGRAALEQRTIHNPDVLNDPEYTYGGHRVDPYRTVLAVPMLKAGEVLGVILIYRHEVRLFSDSHIALMETFADQAVIAIENVRLFNETKEALEHQQTSADILRIVSQSVADSQPAFEAILAAARRLFPGFDSTVWRVDKDRLVAVARGGPTMSSTAGHGVPITPEYAHGTAILERRPVRLDDVESSPEISETSRQDLLSRNRRAILLVPFVRDGDSVGAISVSRSEPYRFSDKQVGLLQAFASQAVIAIENARLFNETKEALERQTATAEILKVIASSPTEVQPVFDVIVERAVRLCGASFGRVYRYDGSTIHMVASHGLSAAGLGQVQRVFPRPASDDTIVGRVILARRPNFLQDIERDQTVPPLSRQMIQALNTRSQVTIPMLRAGEPIGAITMGWDKPEAFDDQQVALLQTFADQAVIAVENVRLFNETKDALEQQTAISEILGVISSSPTDVQPVFDAVLKSATQLCEAHLGVLNLYDGEKFRNVAMRGANPEFAKYVSERGAYRSEGGLARVAAERRPVHIADLREAPPYREHRPNSVKFAELTGARTYLAVPLLKEGTFIGGIVIYRPEVRPFTEKQISLVSTFANQAVIAIENVRLFNETKEALERQTATAEILRVISSSPSDVKPVFDTILSNGARLCEANFAALYLYDGEMLTVPAHQGALPELAEAFKTLRLAPSRAGAIRLAALERRIVQVADITKEPGYKPAVLQLQSARTVLGIPLLREKTLVGVLAMWRTEVRPFTDKQIALLKTFADQAVIAIENVRLFNETKEALERQTATAEILKVISGSPTDEKPVFDAIVASAARLFGRTARIRLIEDGRLVLRARSNRSATDGAVDEPLPLDRNSAGGRVALDRAALQIPDTLAPDAPAAARKLGEAGGYRAMALVPLMRENIVLGVIVVMSPEPGVLAEKQMALLQTFADQAVIAIENVRLFKELQERTEALTKSVGQLTALGEVGQAISSSLELETVLKTIVTHAVKLSGLDAGLVYEYDEARDVVFDLRASEGFDEESLAGMRATPVRPGEGAVGRAIATRAAAEVPDTHAPDYPARLRQLLDRQGFRAILAVPLMREEQTIGALMVLRKAPGAFAPAIVGLLGTLATQSALAIQNARLFREIAEKGQQLEVASQHKSHFLASMSHELRTPLNALLGFNEMLLGGVYGEVPGDMGPPLAQMQSSGKHLLRLINNVLDLAKIEAGRMELSLAEYSVHDTVESVRSSLQPLAVEKGLDFLAAVPSEIPLAYGDPGRITQCLMNLAGNSLKFTKAGKVEISVVMDNGLLRYRVADTGIGIPPDKIEGLFTEFKQTDATVASEYGGTGLGLSISKKFVEMHGGRIWAESEPGSGSVFTFEVPLRAKAP